MINIVRYKYKMCSSYYLSTHSFKVCWEYLAQRRTTKKSHLGHIPQNSKAAQPPAQSSPYRALSNTGHARYPFTGFGGKRIPGIYFCCNKGLFSHTISCFLVILTNMINIIRYKYKMCSSYYLSAHRFKVCWEYLAEKPKAICFHCFKDQSVKSANSRSCNPCSNLPCTFFKTARSIS